MRYDAAVDLEEDRALLRLVSSRAFPLHLAVSILWWMLTKLGVNFE